MPPLSLYIFLSAPKGKAFLVFRLHLFLIDYDGIKMWKLGIKNPRVLISALRSG